MFEAFYKQYFSNLAIQSRRLKAFYYINDRYNVSAFDNAVKSIGQTPALLLEQYDYDVIDKGSRNYMKGLQGQFNILFKTAQGNQASIEDAHVNGEIITDLIIARMRHDFEAGNKIALADDTLSDPVFFTKVSAKVQAIGPINSDYYGTACVFTWETPFTVQVNGTEWKDL